MGRLRKDVGEITPERLEYYLALLAYMIERYAPAYDVCLPIYDRLEEELKRQRETQQKYAALRQRVREWQGRQEKVSVEVPAKVKPLKKRQLDLFK